MNESAASDSTPRSSRRSPAKIVVDVAVVLVAAALLGALAGFLWPQLADPVTVTKTGNGLVRDELALSDQFDALAWFSVTSAVGGLLLGAVMLVWRRTDYLVTVIAVVAGGFLAAWISVTLGLTLGPDDPTAVLAKAADGATAPAALTLGGDPKGAKGSQPADVVYWVWPLFAALGAFLSLISPLSERPIEATVAPEVTPPPDPRVDVSGATEGTPPSWP